MFKSVCKKPTTTIRAAAIAAAILASAAGTADAARVALADVGSWKGSAFTNDDTGRFSHCVFGRNYDNGMRLMFGVAADKTWSFGFANDEWSMKKGQKYKVSYSVDGVDNRRGTALVKSKTLAQVLMPLDKKLMDSFMHGEQLYVKTGNAKLRFGLGEVRPMLLELFKCAKKHIKTASTEPKGNEFEADEASPFESKPAAANDGDRLDQTRKESRTAVNYMLKEAGVTGKMVGRDDQPTLVKQNDVVWRMPNMIGAFRIVAEDGVTLEQVRKHISGSDHKVCDGKFSSGRISEDSSSSYDFMTVCAAKSGQVTDRALSIYYVVLPRREGGFYFMSIIGLTKEKHKVRAMGLHLKSAAVALNAKGSVPGARPIQS